MNCTAWASQSRRHRDTITRYGIDCHHERPQRPVGCHGGYQIEHLREAWPRPRPTASTSSSWTRSRRALIDSPTYPSGVTSAWWIRRDCVGDSGRRVAGWIVERAPVRGGPVLSGGNVEVRTYSGSVTTQRRTGHCRPQPLLRISAFVVPVFDQRGRGPARHRLTCSDSIGWTGRQGVSDSGNQFHYYRLTHDNRSWGGYDAVYDSERPSPTNATTTVMTVQHLHDTFPPSPRFPSSRLGRRHIDNSLPIQCLALPSWLACPTGVGFTGLGVGALAPGADTADGRLGHNGSDTETYPAEAGRCAASCCRSAGTRPADRDRRTRKSLSDADDGGRRNLAEDHRMGLLEADNRG